MRRRTDEKNRPLKTFYSLVLAVLGAWPAVSHAHHILGLPHYKYSDTYPQTPFLEVEATAGGYEVKFVTYPGIPRPNELVRVQVRVCDQATGDTFTGPVTFRVQQRRWPFGTKILQPERPMTVTELEQLDPDTRFGSAAEDQEEGRKTRQYSSRVQFPEDGPFQIVVSFQSRDGRENIPFPVSVGNPGPDLLLLGLGGLILGGTILTVALLRQRKRQIQADQPSAAAAEMAGI